ncbi:hypothetical protein [Streptomyces sp. 2A115]|uniref:hypothetical protein n=1 Tax=Streptomyces sp. 2A115 TaxID=3457439 RepID=UPI003FD0426B
MQISGPDARRVLLLVRDLADAQSLEELPEQGEIMTATSPHAQAAAGGATSERSASRVLTGITAVLGPLLLTQSRLTQSHPTQCPTQSHLTQSHLTRGMNGAPGGPSQVLRALRAHVAGRVSPRAVV